MLKPIKVCVLLILPLSASVLRAQDRPPQEVIRAAVSPLPTDLQAGAGVMAETPDGDIKRIRESENGLSCLLRHPSDPEEPFLDARCYNDQFWPVVLHRWSLVPIPESFADADARMHADIEAGLVPIPDHPTAGYRVFGPLNEFDFASGTLGPTMQKWQSIHFPFRTSSELGITELREGSIEDRPGLMPFVMASGTWWSHVMFMHEPWPWR